MWSSSSNSIISTFSLINAILVQAWITSLWRACEPWNISVDHSNSMPPFPMSIDLIIEPYECAPSNSHISSPLSIKVRFNDSVCSIHVGLSRDWHCTWNSPWISVCCWLTLCAWHAECDTLWKTGLSKFRNRDLHTDWVLVGETLSNWPGACSWCWSWFLELKWPIFFYWIAIVLW